MPALPLAALLLGSMSATPALAEDKALVEWTFDQAGDLQGWQANGMLAEVKVADGLLTGKVTDRDPFLFSPVFEIAATPWQRIEVRMKCNRPGGCEFFWANGEKTEYQGFSPGKETPFQVLGDNEFHVYRLRPFWHAEKKIVQLRFDLMARGDGFAVDWIRIIDPGPPPSRAEPVWGFRTGEVGGWQALEGIEGLKVAGGALSGRVASGEVLLLGPALSTPVEARLYVSLRLRVSGGAYGAVRFASSERSGLQEHRFPLRADGKLHTYNLDMSPDAGWKGTLLALGLQPTDLAGATFDLAEIRIAADPAGPTDLAVTYAGPTDAIARAGKPTTVGCVVVNHGGTAAERLRVRLGLPGAARLAPNESADRYVRVDFAVPQFVEWKIVAERPDEVRPSFTLTPQGGEAFAVEGKPVKVTRSLNLPRAAYVPEPKPAATDYLVGTYYFPGWTSMRSWQCIQDIAPERKPVLGWYNEGSPEVVDWQIKWAAEHGISFFMVDWYWCAGGRSLDHWLHNGYLKARWRKYLKFALMWANHNPPNTHSVEDWRKVTQYWLDNYFKLPEYLRIDDRPAVFVWAPTNVRHDLGGTQEAAKLYALSQEMARAAGYKGIYFVAMGAHESDAQVKDLVAEGYEGATTYHWWGDGPQKAKDSRYFPFELVTQTAEAAWERHDALIANRLLYLPTVDTGWASQPWHHEKAMVIHGRTPELFERLCRDAKAFVDARGRKIIALGPCNEWGEGSYIEPCAEYGFEMYDAIRRVFCKPGNWSPNVAPIDVGLGPYDYPPTQDRSAWEFNTDGDAEGWGPMMGMGDFAVKGGALTCTTTSRDPAFNGPVLRIPAERYRRVLIRMKTDQIAQAGEQGQLFWETATAGISEAASVHFELVADNQYHDYMLKVGESDRWRGSIRGFRLDPCSTNGAHVAIDAVRLLPD